jgi:hypothetical protein
MYKLFSFFTLLLFISSCAKDSTTNPPGNTSTKTSWNDGTDKTADSTIAILYSSNGKRTMDIYIFKGGTTINGLFHPKQPLEMHCVPKSGTQTVIDTDDNAWLTYFPNDTSYWNGKSGNFNLTICDTATGSIKGTFDFKGSNTGESITKGVLFVDVLRKQ